MLNVRLVIRNLAQEQKPVADWDMKYPPLLWDTIRVQNVNYNVTGRIWFGPDELLVVLEEIE